MSPPKSAQNSRKSNFYNSQSNGNWKSEYPVKCNKCNKIHEDSHNSEEGRLEMKTSDETISATHSEDNTEDAYAQEPGHQAEYQYDNYYQHDGMRTHAEAVLAKLKELQWRRDALERHYTYGVRKIINDYFFQNSAAGRGDVAAVEERMRAGGVKKSQSSGVRLECGCTHFCERNLQKSLTKQSGPQLANYSGECRGRCSTKYEAVRSPRNSF